MTPGGSWLLAICLGWLLLGGGPTLSATEVTFSHGGYSISGNAVTLTMYDIANNGSNTSGTLRIELWAFPQPYDSTPGASGSGFRVAVSPPLGQLDGNSSYTTDPITDTAFFNAIAKGNYYMTLVITEYTGASTDDGFTFDDAASDDGTTAFRPATGDRFGVASAVQVGSGYFYDSDLGYLYPYFDGWVYSDDLNRYFYINIGSDFTTGVYIYDLSHSSWTYTEQSFWPYVYYFDGTGWVDTGFN